MPTLFEPSALNGLILANRTVRSATHERLADTDGRATPELTGLLAKLAEGETGLIISGHAAVSLEGNAGAKQLLANDDVALPGLKDITAAVHAAGGKIALQLAHGGILAQPCPGLVPLGPSRHPTEPAHPGRAFTVEEIDRTVRAFAAAAVRAKKADFDAVQIHAAHTYMLSQFLSPFFNKRDDEYGGSLENRARFLLRVLRATRESVGPDFPVLVKINCQDFLEPGLSAEESVEVGLMLEAASADCIEISGGSVMPGASILTSRTCQKGDDEVYYRKEAEAFKKRLRIPLMLVGGIRKRATAEQLLQDGLADYIAMCRPLILDPMLVKNWRLGLADASPCISDNACRGPREEGMPFCCPTFAKKRH